MAEGGCASGRNGTASKNALEVVDAESLILVGAADRSWRVGVLGAGTTMFVLEGNV